MIPTVRRKSAGALFERFACTIACWAVILGSSAVQPTAASDTAGVFDYYALTLSWSPTYCQSDQGRNNRHQCGDGKRFSFVVHGLWPQNEQGWPQDCATSQRYIPEQVIRDVLDIMPSKSLVIHEWRKHGTCSGLSSQAYFQLTRALFERVKIPARFITPTRHVSTTTRELKRDFIKTNPWLDHAALSVQCGNRRDRANLRSLRICFSRDLKPRACGDNERRQCRAKTLIMPPVR